MINSNILKLLIVKRMEKKVLKEDLGKDFKGFDE